MIDQMDGFDVIILGTGAAGLVAALAAHESGLQVLVLEKSAQWGGTTAISGGVLWVPGNHMMQQEGAADNIEAAASYLAAITADCGPATSPARRAAFLREAPAMLQFLSGLGVRFIRNAAMPDYESEIPGASKGRGVESAMVDARLLGPGDSFWRRTLRQPSHRLPPFSTTEAASLPHARRHPRAILTAARIMLRAAAHRALGRTPVMVGTGLVVQLMAKIQARGIPVRLGVNVERLLVDDGGAVRGVRTQNDTIAARIGVLLCAGGFAHNAALRREYQAEGVGLSNAADGDTGDAIALAQDVGAETALMDSAWWMPTILVAPAVPAITLPERALPGSIIVDATGRRYMNEAANYMRAGRAMADHGNGPSWLITDAKFHRRYLTSLTAARQGPGAVTAPTLEALAAGCGLPRDSFIETVRRFNAGAIRGLDEAFGRGSAKYDVYWGDPMHRPNPTLAPIAIPPFHAVPIFAGDIGTNGGLLTDEHGRVLNHAGMPIRGLWAAGNASASVMGRSYGGGGATIAAAAAFGYIAARDAAARIRNTPLAAAATN